MTSLKYQLDTISDLYQKSKSDLCKNVIFGWNQPLKKIIIVKTKDSSIRI